MSRVQRIAYESESAGPAGVTGTAGPADIAAVTFDPPASASPSGTSAVAGAHCSTDGRSPYAYALQRLGYKKCCTTIVRGDGRRGDAIDGFVRGMVVDDTQDTRPLYFTSGYAVYRLDGDGKVAVFAGMHCRDADSDGDGDEDGDGDGDDSKSDDDADDCRDGKGNAMFSDRTLVVLDWDSNRIRTVAVDGQVTTLAGGGPIGAMSRPAPSVDGRGEVARFANLEGICVDRRNDAAFVVDGFCVRSVARDGTVTTIAGSSASRGHVDGVGNLARFVRPRAIAAGENATLYVADAKCVRRLVHSPGAAAVSDRMRLAPAVAAWPRVLLPIVLAYLPAEGWHVDTIAVRPVEAADDSPESVCSPPFDKLASIVYVADAVNPHCIVHDEALGRTYWVSVL